MNMTEVSKDTLKESNLEDSKNKLEECEKALKKNKEKENEWYKDCNEKKLYNHHSSHLYYEKKIIKNNMHRYKCFIACYKYPSYHRFNLWKLMNLMKEIEKYRCGLDGSESHGTYAIHHNLRDYEKEAILHMMHD